jgi:hypothetical protein
MSHTVLTALLGALEATYGLKIEAEDRRKEVKKKKKTMARVLGA